MIAKVVNVCLETVAVQRIAMVDRFASRLHFVVHVQRKAIATLERSVCWVHAKRATVPRMQVAKTRCARTMYALLVLTRLTIAHVAMVRSV